MASTVSANTHNACSFFGSIYATLKTWFENVHEYFTHHKETLGKIDKLRERFLKTKQAFEVDDPASLDKAIKDLKCLLEDNALFQNKRLVNHVRIKTEYDSFNQDLEALRQYAVAHKVDQWKSTYFPTESNAMKEKESILRWMSSTEGQRRFAAYYNVDIPYKFSEIPAGSILLTDPYAYLKHMELEGKLPLARAITLNFKSLVCRLATGKQFTHVEYAMGNGKVFDLDKRKTGFCQGDGNVVDKGDKVFYGMVLAPNESLLLRDHTERYKSAASKTFGELSQRINAEIEKATLAKKVTLSGWDILKTLFTKKRHSDYEPMRAWKDGACHFSCSGTTAALLAHFGPDVGDQLRTRKMCENVTPTDFYHSRYWTPLYVIDSLDIKGRG